MFATSNGYKDIVKLLIESGANFNSVDKRGRSALMLATSANHKIKNMRDKFSGLLGLKDDNQNSRPKLKQ